MVFVLDSWMDTNLCPSIINRQVNHRFCMHSFNTFKPNSFALNFLGTDLTDSGNSLTDMRNKLTLGCLPGQKPEIKKPC
jgi:hypothetical protein